MIVLDIETSGLGYKCGIWQIGALELETANNCFLEEARIDNDDIVTEEALRIIGKTEAELRDIKKQSQRQLILNYFNWVKKIREKIQCGQNLGWDVTRIMDRCEKYGILDLYRDVIGQRVIDLHTHAQQKYKEINGRYLLAENGKSDMNLTNILKLCGIPDERIRVEKGKVVQRGKKNEALEDCRLEGECFCRIEYGKNLFPEYVQFPVPNYLINLDKMEASKK